MEMTTDKRSMVISKFDQIRNYMGNQSPFIRVLTSLYLFDFLDRLKEMDFPDNWISMLDMELKELEKLSFFFFKKLLNDKNWESLNWINDGENNVELKTGEVYFKLCRDFDEKEYYDKTFSLLSNRLSKNDIDLSLVGKALDAGCGSGRYTIALKKLGCKQVYGVDISQNSIEFALSKNPFQNNGVEFRQGSVLDLPFEDNSFDFVFSNGVLHHTLSTEQGLKEIRRVLKPGGYCWLYLYGGKNSFFWDLVDLCRDLLKGIPQSYLQMVMKLLGYPVGRIFHRADFFYVPLHRRYFSHEVENMVEEAGFSSARRLKRGDEIDWDEIIYKNPNIDTYIYGEGEMRYFLQG